MPKHLLIVESPAKAKTIERYLGKDFKVKSSYGHIRDLDKGAKAIDIDNNFKLKYVVSPEKQKVVKELKSWVSKVDEVWLATDEDREGEAISWHLCEVLGLDENTTKRIVFREITKSAITKAIESPRLVDQHLVSAQQARRVLDRLVGFELSETLWRKVRNKLSAGRVQSVAVRLIVDREREITNFDQHGFYGLEALFDVKGASGQPAKMKATREAKFEEQETVHDYLQQCASATYTIQDIQKKPAKQNPAPPFTTSTLQQEASRRLGFAVRRTMQVAQRLYEKGLITYMRTDSVHLSNTALKAIEETIKSKYGERYHQFRKYKGKSQNAQEAHEAIRPTYFEQSSVSGERDEVRLYELIWKRAMACQMASAELEKTEVQIGISTMPKEVLLAKGEVLKFDGFRKLYIKTSEDDVQEEKGLLPPLTVGQTLTLDYMEAREKYTKAPARFSEAALVKKLEENGIGRPSTYAPTITKIMEAGRGYVVKQSSDGQERDVQVIKLSSGEITTTSVKERYGVYKNRLVPTDMGMIVTDFLCDHFSDIMDYSFTADIEEDFDEIAAGDRNWTEMVEAFYRPFHVKIERTKSEADRASGERKLGKHPEDGHTILVRMARYGPVVQWGTTEEVGENGQVRYANLQPGQSLETISFEEALDAFKLPRTLGEYKGKTVEVNTGRYGPYIRYDEGYINIGRGSDPMSFTMDEAVIKIEEKIEADRPVMSFKGMPVTKGKGRFGPFLKWNDMYVNIPRKIDPDTINQEQMVELIEKKIEKEANRYVHRWEDLDLAVENGRWGPFIRFKKKSIKLPPGQDGKRMTSEEAKTLTLEQVKAKVEEEVPGAFAPKKKRAGKSGAKKK